MKKLLSLILALMMLLLKKGKAVYLLAIPAAVIYGVLLDGAMGLLGQLSPMGFWGRLGLYSLGVLVCTASLSLLFHSYLPPAAYEMLVKTLAARYKWKLIYVKTVYDLCSLGISVALSLLLLGSVQGIGAGTVVCALIYGWMIGLFGKLFGKYWQFRDRFALRSVFEESEEII